MSALRELLRSVPSHKGHAFGAYIGWTKDPDCLALCYEDLIDPECWEEIISKNQKLF
jgi:hypothetical protein